MPTLIAFCILTASTLLGLYRRDLLFWLMVLCLPAYTLRLTVGPIPTTVLELVVLGFVLSAAIKAVSALPEARQGNLGRLRRFLTASPLGWLPLLFLANALFEALISPDLRSALGIWKAYFLEPVLVYYVLVHEMQWEGLPSPQRRGQGEVSPLDQKFQIPLNPPFSKGETSSQLVNPLTRPCPPTRPLKPFRRKRKLHQRRREPVNAFLFPMLFLSLLSICQYIFNFGLHRGFDDPTRGRVLAVFNTPNAVGLFLAPLIALFLPAFVDAICAQVRNRFPSPRRRGQARTEFNRSGEVSSNTNPLSSPPVPDEARNERPPLRGEEKSPPYQGGVARPRDRVVDFLLLLTIPLSTLALILSFSRGGWLGLGAALAVYIVIKHGRKAVIPLLLCAVLSSSLAFLTIPRFRTFFQPTGNELDLVGDNSTNVRLNLWSRTVDMLSEHLAFGAGLAGFQTAYRERGIPDWEEVTLYPHNIVLNFWSETGLVGLILFFWIVAATIYRLIAHGLNRGLSSEILLFLTAFLVHGLVDVPYFKNDLSLIFWIVLSFSTLSFER